MVIVSFWKNFLATFSFFPIFSSSRHFLSTWCNSCVLAYMCNSTHLKDLELWKCGVMGMPTKISTVALCTWAARVPLVSRSCLGLFTGIGQFHREDQFCTGISVRIQREKEDASFCIRHENVLFWEWYPAICSFR